MAGNTYAQVRGRGQKALKAKIKETYSMLNAVYVNGRKSSKTGNML